MSIEEIIRRLNDVTMDGDLYDSLVAALQAGQKMRRWPYQEDQTWAECAEAWDVATQEMKETSDV